MTNHQLKNLLRSLKDQPAKGESFGDAEKNRVWSKIAAGIGADPTLKPRAYTVWEYLEYLSFEAQTALVRPMVTAAGTVGLILSGAVATVGATNSLPGDLLYPVKLATERVQLSFSSSSEQRVRLHSEFAERRLQEAVDLTTSNEPQNAARLKQAVAGFKGELNSAHGELSGLQAGQAVVAAAALSRKTADFSALISQSEASLDDSAKSDVTAAKEAVKDSQTQVVDTLVNAYKVTQESAPLEELQSNFRKRYQGIVDRIHMSEQRVLAIRGVLKRLPAAEVAPYQAYIEATLAALRSFEKPLSNTMNVMASGGYRSAFDLLITVDEDLASVEANLALHEIQLTTSLNDAP